MGERGQLVWAPTGEVLTWARVPGQGETASAAKANVSVFCDGYNRWVARCEGPPPFSRQLEVGDGQSPQEALDILSRRLRRRCEEMAAALGIRSAEDERAAAAAIVRELEDSYRTTAHEHCGRGSASQEAFEIAAEAAAVAIQAIERGEHVGGGSDGE